MILLNKKLYLALIFIVGFQSAPIYSDAGFMSTFSPMNYSIIANNQKIVLSCLLGFCVALLVNYLIPAFILQKKISGILKRLQLKPLVAYAEKKRLVSDVIMTCSSTTKNEKNEEIDYFDFPKESTLNFALLTGKPTMDISSIEGVQSNIGMILGDIQTQGGFGNLSYFDRIAYRALVKEEEESFEDNHKIRCLVSKTGEIPLSQLPSGVSKFKNIINNGLNYNDNSQPLLSSNEITISGNTQIEHFFDAGLDNTIPKSSFLYHIETIKDDKGKWLKHHLCVENAKLYAQLTHYYSESIGAIAKIFENTQDALKKNPCPVICVH